MPEEVDTKFLIMALPTIRQDYHAFETYFEEYGPSGVSVPITVIHVVDDPIVSSDESKGWEKYSSNTMDLHEIDGGHFYLTKEGNSLLTVCSIITEEGDRLARASI
jgi:surfactin synthase thioesterase subunit